MTMTTELVELADKWQDEAAMHHTRAESVSATDPIESGIFKAAAATLRSAADELRVLASRAGGWLPIESAPKDHLPRLYLCRGRVVQGFVDVTDTLMVQHELGWRRMRRNPSHWRPLPTLPGKAIAALDSEESK